MFYIYRCIALIAFTECSCQISSRWIMRSFETAYGMGNCWSNLAKAVFLEVEADHMRSSRNRTLWDSWSPGSWELKPRVRTWLGASGLSCGLVCFCCTWLHCYLRLSDRIPTPHVSSELVQDFGTECLCDFQMLIHHQNVHGILGIQQLHVDERWEDQEKLRRTMLWKVKNTASA